MEQKEIIQHRFQQAGLELTDRQTEQYAQYAKLLVEWNSVMNLTGITEFEEIVEKHFLDSVAIGFAEHVSRETNGRLIDVGSGAGFPGIPLKILFPHLKVTLLDSLNKRVNFLQEVIHSLHLEQIEAVHGRAEDLAKDLRYREQYDLCVSRAVANLSTLTEYCLPFIRKGGFFVAYKSGKVEEELQNAKKAIKVLGGAIQRKESFVLPGTEIDRSLIFMKKVEYTPKKYPRKAGLPSKQPLA
ncbi:16S rRNA (guanine(527)-N(7))-methyltransferase RsmG [Hominifimenecus sp. rT4P-3]|uniref:16S rRNA (guanine(527)-N(7))-methyltransferase RsmG n=1 Tax=Hominifimenecus sp. rT4P-3 TaxID=3242979 RepID=UPI003DA31C48